MHDKPATPKPPQNMNEHNNNNLKPPNPLEREAIPISRPIILPILAVLCLSCLSGYLFGRLRWSVLWPIVSFVLAYSLLTRKIARYIFQYRQHLAREAVRPRIERHIEKLEWVNFLIEKFWVMIEPAMSIRVAEKLNSILDEKCPSFLESLELTEFTLGSSAPILLGSKVFPQTDPEVIQFDLDLSFVPDEIDDANNSNFWHSKIVLVSRIGKGIFGVDIPIMVKGIAIYGRVRIQLDLIPTSPFVNQVQFCFLEPPKIDFILKPLKSIDIMDLPGLSDWLSKLLGDTISSKLVDPNVITIPVISRTSGGRSIGVIKVTIVQIRGLKSSLGVGSPKVRIQIAGKVKATSQSIDTDSSNQVFHVLVNSLKNPLTLVVLSEGGNVIGSVTYPLSDVLTDEMSSNVWRTIVKHESSKIKGEMNFGVEFFAAQDVLDPEADLRHKSGVAQITIHQVKELLDPRQKKYLNCFYEIFVHENGNGFVFKESHENYDPQKYFRSRTKKRTINPSWEEIFEVFIENTEDAFITIILRHGSKDDVIFGVWTSPFTPLINRTDWFDIPGTDSGQIYGSFMFRPVLIDNSSAHLARQKPSIALLKLKVLSASNMKTSRGTYHVSVCSNTGELFGKTKTSLTEANPVWNKLITGMLNGSEDYIRVIVTYTERNSEYGHLNINISELMKYPNCDVDRNDVLYDEEGGALNCKLRYIAGIYPIERDEMAVVPEEEGEEEEMTRNVVPIEAMKMESNCGVLEIHKVVITGIAPTTINSAHYVELTWDSTEVFYMSSTIKMNSIDPSKKHELDEYREAPIRDIEKLEVQIRVNETQDQNTALIGTLKVPLMDLKSNHWYKLNPEGEIKLVSFYRPLSLELPVEEEESGILYLTLLSAKNLIAVDSGISSDPFCVVRLNGSKVYKSKVVKKCLDPEWNEVCPIEIKQKDVSVLQLELRDWNKVTFSRTLGLVEVDLQNLHPERWETLNLPLENVSSGSIQFKLKFVPANSTTAKNVSTEEMLESAIAVAAPVTYQEESLHELSQQKFIEKSTEAIIEEPLPVSGITSRESSIVTSSSSFMRSLRPSSAAGLKITISHLIIEPLRPFSCKIKVKHDNRTFFKTRSIGGTSHNWNESFVVDAKTDLKFSFVITWDMSFDDPHFEIVPSKLPFPEVDMENILDFEVDDAGLKAKFYLKYSLTNDTQNLIDPNKKHRFSLFK